MFHVKRTVLVAIIMIAIVSCASQQATIPVGDFILLPSGKEYGGAKNLTAFVFENDRKKMAFEQFVTSKVNASTLSEAIEVRIDGDRYRLLIYDYAEFDKYFGYRNYTVTRDVPDETEIRDKRPFLAISMLNASNEDCLDEHALQRNICIKYLENLKSEFYKL